MPSAPKPIEAVPVGRIFLLLGNPRHKPFDTEAQAIAYLCDKEFVYPLARDIAELGLNPLERFALIPAEKRKTNQPPHNYYVAEGNRRVCAIKLLNDPELAPPNLRKSFEKLAETWRPIKTVSGVLFDGVESVKVWLDRTHTGEQGGIGRRKWDAEQKSRSDGDSKNKPAQALLDYAQKQGMITVEERKGKLTTVQRFVANDFFREQLGYDQTIPGQVGITRPKEQFDVILRRFMRDLVGKTKVNSRMNKDPIIKYARPLSSLPGVTNERTEAEVLSVGGSPLRSKAPKQRTMRKPENAQHVQFESSVYDALKSYGNDKLERLYYSICKVDLDPHTPLIAVGTWSFVETLTACAGRAHGTDFESFLSKQRLANWGVTGDTNSVRQAIARIKQYGNSTKHHPVAGAFNGDQLNNDMITLKEVILMCVAEAGKSP
jgi:hypothetical protein